MSFLEIMGVIFLILLMLFGITIYKLDRLAFGGKWWTEGEKKSGKEQVNIDTCP